MKTLFKKMMQGNLIITDPLYVVKQDKLEDDNTKPVKESFYPKDWIPPTEDDFFNVTEKSLLAKRYEQNYKDALDNWYDKLPNDWDVCNYGDSMNHLGFCNYIVADTIYGPWSCTTYKLTNDIIGRFTSDSGLVGVFILDEILQYNSKWDLHLSKPYCATFIPNFSGNISVVNAGGDSPGDCDVRIVGNGNILFYTKQTGF